MTEVVIGGHLMEQAAEVEVDRLVEQLPQHLLEQEPLLGPLLATHRPNTEVTSFFREDLGLDFIFFRLCTQ